MFLSQGMAFLVSKLETLSFEDAFMWTLVAVNRSPTSPRITQLLVSTFFSQLTLSMTSFRVALPRHKQWSPHLGTQRQSLVFPQCTFFFECQSLRYVSRFTSPENLPLPPLLTENTVLCLDSSSLCHRRGDIPSQNDKFSVGFTLLSIPVLRYQTPKHIYLYMLPSFAELQHECSFYRKYTLEVGADFLLENKRETVCKNK